MLSEASPNGFGLTLALTNQTKVAQTIPPEEQAEQLDKLRKETLEDEIRLLVNQIGKQGAPLG